jgi:uncharacterized protein (TIGR03083 family)
MDEMARRVSLIQGLTERLKEFLGALPTEAWELPSACELWQVRDVVAHLTGGAERQIESMARGLRGDASPPPTFASMDAATMSAHNARRDIALRERLGEGLLATFAARYDELEELLARFGPQDWVKSCWHARRKVLAAREYVDLRIQELAIHDWDIRWAIESEPHLDAESVPLLLEVAPTWLGMSFRPGPRLPSPLVYRFDVTGKPSRRHLVVVAGDSFRVIPGSEAEADVVLRCDSETYLLLVCGRLRAAGAVAEGRLAVAGDARLVEQFQEWFGGL